MSSQITVLTRSVPLFDVWASRTGITKNFNLTFLNGSTIGIDAVYFLERLASKEPHLSAVGGSHALASLITSFTNHLQSAGLSLHFVFDGLSIGSGDGRVINSKRAAALNSQAFELYTSNEAAPACESFQCAGLSDFTTLTGILKKTLHELGIPFTVAPYSALAQLVYYERHPSQFIDAVFGPSELFCFGIDKVITSFAPEKSEFGWIRLQDCLTELGNIPIQVFIDGLMLAGSSLLSQFPSISNQALYPKGASMRNLIDLITSGGGSVSRLCAQFSTESSIKEVYLDQYKRATTSVRHQMIIAAEGDVEPLHKQHVPDDVHECIGLRLPEELYMYLSRGMLGPRVLNWLTSGTIIIMQPLAGGDSDIYQELVKTQLDPLRRQALSLLTEPIHRDYHTKEIKTKLWFDPEYEGKFNMRELPSMKDLLSKWNVKNDLFAGLPEDMPPGTFSFAVSILEHADLAAKTITPKPKAGQQLLKTRNEVLANVVWRSLQLRGYVDEQHQLTGWGKVLQEALFAAGTSKHEEEAVFLAVEMLRFEVVNPDTMFLGYSGAPEHGSPIDKRNCMLVSRVACLGKVIHEQKAYSGPLSRHLLAYQSIISNVHATLRDLMEMVLVGMFLEGLVDRDRDDWVEISLGLPFYEEQSCALGVLTMTYLDDLATYPDANSEKLRNEVVGKGQEWFQSTDFRRSLEDAFKIWDAVYEGVKAAGDKVKDHKMWDEVNTWLLERR